MRGPDTYKYKKLDRVKKYTQGKIVLPLILSINKSGNIKWYVYAAFTVHMDTMSHTGGFINTGTGEYYVHYNKHNLNTKSSTEEKLFRVVDVLTQVI